MNILESESVLEICFKTFDMILMLLGQLNLKQLMVYSAATHLHSSRKFISVHTTIHGVNIIFKNCQIKKDTFRNNSSEILFYVMI